MITSRTRAQIGSGEDWIERFHLIQFASNLSVKRSSDSTQEKRHRILPPVAQKWSELAYRFSSDSTAIRRGITTFILTTNSYLNAIKSL